MAKEHIENPITFDYDGTADVLHVTFGTGEPSFGEEIDDWMLLEIGMYSGAPTGFQLLHVTEDGVENVRVQLERVTEIVKNWQVQITTKALAERQQFFESALEQAKEKARVLVPA